MNVGIKECARAYIRDKGKAVHLVAYQNISMCCGKIDLPPTVSLGVPKNIKSYNRKEVDGIDLYLPKEFDCKHMLNIKLGKMLGISSLKIEGWKVL